MDGWKETPVRQWIDSISVRRAQCVDGTNRIVDDCGSAALTERIVKIVRSIADRQTPITTDVTSDTVVSDHRRSARAACVVTEQAVPASRQTTS